MCDTCGCNESEYENQADVQPRGKRVPVVQNILSANEQAAARNRAHFKEQGTTAINLMSSPGGGKTTLILATIAALDRKVRVGVIEGDVASSVDADKIAATDTPVVQINTGGGCHLDAPMVHQAVQALAAEVTKAAKAEEDLELLFIENVGNLICPVSFDLGETYKVGIISVPEGHDKPYKYPEIFEAVDLVLVTKADLMPYLDFDSQAFQEVVHSLNPDVPILTLSAKTGDGLQAWIEWIGHGLQK
jgi:hydrogenase nickel incorporation protein HypB